MFELSNPRLTKTSQKLRVNMTKEERALWYRFFVTLPITVRRQKVIGDYIVDFYCSSAKLVVEVDGSQHYEDEGKQHDKVRDEFLRSLGLTVLRYSNKDIHEHFDAVCRDIAIHLGLE